MKCLDAKNVDEAIILANTSLISQHHARTIDDAEIGSPEHGLALRESALTINIANPRDRLTYCKPIDIFNLVGQWLCFLKGANDLPMWQFYNTRAMGFSDDHETLRGTWGERFLDCSKRLTYLLQVLPNTRRAVMPIFIPEDIGNPSKNLPCLALCQFLFVEEKLNMYTYMRSQSSWGVLPYDLFLLTMLHEWVALSANMEIGTYTHICPSITIRGVDAESALLSALPKMPREKHMPMSRMPEVQLSVLFNTEEMFRLDDPLSLSNFYEELLPSYWKGFLRIVAMRRSLYDLTSHSVLAQKAATETFGEPFMRKCLDRIQNEMKKRSER